MIGFLNAAVSLVPWALRNRIKRVPVLSALQRVIVSSTLDGKEFTYRVNAGPAEGISFHVRLPEDKGIWTGTYEFDFARCLSGAIKPGAVAYDIGSWHGFFAGVMAAQGAREVHVFEPLPQNAERVGKLMVLNPSKSIQLHACAVANADGEMDLVVMPETSMAKLEISQFQVGRTSHRKIRVPVRSIDSKIAAGEAPPPQLMKIDVEGAELLVLRGALHTIRTHHPEIFAEVHSPALLSQCVGLLQLEGYTIEDIGNDRDAARSKDVFQIRAYAGGAT